MSIVKVEPLTTTRAVRGPFDYRLREDQVEVGVGSILRVRFANRPVPAVVTGLAETSELPDERLAEPESVLEASLPADLVELALWMASEYVSTPARALSLLLPPAGRPKEVLVAELTVAGQGALAGDVRLTDAQRALLTELAGRGRSIAADLGTPALRRLERRG